MASNSPNQSNPPWLQIAIALIALIGVLGAALIANNYFRNKLLDGTPTVSPTHTNFTVIPSNPTLNDTGVPIHQGDDVQVSAEAKDTWSCYPGETPVGAGGDGAYSPPPEYSQDKLALPNAPFCSLIGRVGMNGRLLSIGTDDNHFTADTSGNLFLGANDILPEKCPLANKNQCYTDNTGQINVTITVQNNGNA